MTAISLWWDLDASTEKLTPGPAGDTTADVTIVGGGLTGLWTAFYLTEADPGLDIVILEQEAVGFGASGRNGGWCSALFPASGDALARRHGPDAARSMRQAMRDTVVEVGDICASHEIDCGYSRGGTISLARSEVQLARIKQSQEADNRWGDETELLNAAEARSHAAADGLVGGAWNPDCARIQPLSLVRGLAALVRSRGVRIFEQTRAISIEPGLVRTERGRVRTHWSVRATEAWTSQLPGARRQIAPVYSLMVATAPLEPEIWDAIGLAGNETFHDGRNVIMYGQRTLDGRIAFGGRGAPYHHGSRIDPAFDQDESVFARLRGELVTMFPQLAGVEFTHAWGGALGIPRDWNASVGMNPDTGMGWAGGYVGDGVSTTNLAGRTLADLMTGRRSALVRLPWVGHHSPNWEPEPLRWAGITSGLRAAEWLDATEHTSGKVSPFARVLSRLTGH